MKAWCKMNKRKWAINARRNYKLELVCWDFGHAERVTYKKRATEPVRDALRLDTSSWRRYLQKPRLTPIELDWS